MKVLLLGAPGAGKGTQAQFITAAFGIPRTILALCKAAVWPMPAAANARTPASLCAKASWHVNLSALSGQRS